eukprot:gene33488-43010_t
MLFNMKYNPSWRSDGALVICVGLEKEKIWLPDVRNLPPAARGTLRMRCEPHRAVNGRVYPNKWLKDLVQPEALTRRVVEGLKASAGGKGARPLDDWETPVSLKDQVQAEAVRLAEAHLSSCTMTRLAAPEQGWEVGVRGAKVRAEIRRASRLEGQNGLLLRLHMTAGGGKLVPMSVGYFDLLIVVFDEGLYLIPAEALRRRDYLRDSTAGHKGRTNLYVYPYGASSRKRGLQADTWADEWQVHAEKAGVAGEMVVRSVAQGQPAAALLAELRGCGAVRAEGEDALAESTAGRRGASGVPQSSAGSESGKGGAAV